MDDTEKVIEYINDYNITYNNELRQAIKLLQDGKKYKQIVEDVKQYIIDRQTIEEDFCTNGNEIIDLINWLKRKNFPKQKALLRKTKLDKAIKEVGDMRIADEKEENEKKYDKWFRNLSAFHKSFVAYNFWDNASYKEKKEEYELE